MTFPVLGVNLLMMVGAVLGVNNHYKSQHQRLLQRTRHHYLMIQCHRY
jgi:hypothetical protein